MTRQVPTPAELTQVSDDFDTFQLPFEASLDLSRSGRTVYGVTDTAVDLSMVNVAHLNNTRHFRGIWELSPTDLGAPTPYREGQVVIGSDNHLYVRNATGTDNPNPTTTGQTAWILLSVGLEQPVTELTTTDPVDLNLYAGSQTARFVISPSANATLVDPQITLTGISVGANINTSGALTVTAPSNLTTAGTTIITTDARSTSVEGTSTVTHEGGQVDSIVNFIDARQAPEITPGPDADVRVSLLDAAQSAVFNINLTPGSSSVANGTAYAARWSATAGTMPATPFSPSAPTFTLPQITTNTMITFNYDIPAGAMNGQAGSTPPPSESRMVNVYTPWFWQFGGDQPTGIASMTEAVLVGDIQGNNFPVDNSSQISISSTMTRTIQFLWLAIPSVVNRNITLNTGISTVTGTRVPNAFTAREGTAFAQYDIYQFRIGLVNSPTIFNINSTLIS